MHGSQHDLQQPVSGEDLSVITRPRDRVHDIADIVLTRQRVIQLAQIIRRIGFASDLEELDADLPRLGPPRIQLLGRLHDDGLDIVAGHAVRDHDDVHRLYAHFLAVGLAFGRLLHLGEVWFEDVVEPCAGRGAAERTDRVEDALDADGGGDVGVAAGGILGVAMIEEIDVDAVGIVGGADGRDGTESCCGFAPASACHAAAVVDEEDGIELGEEGVGRITRRLHGTRDDCRVGGW